MPFTYGYTTIADSAIDPDSPIDTALMTAIRNNIVVVYEYVGGKSYTPAEPHNHNGVNSALISIIADGAVSTEAKLAAAVVSQSKLKVASGDDSMNYTSTDLTGISRFWVPPGGIYGLGWDHSISGSTSYSSMQLEIVHRAPVVSAPVTNVVMGLFLNYSGMASDSSGTGTVTQWYIQASPPYDLGDGLVPLFVFALVGDDGAVKRVWSAPDAPWHYNGPTDIRPQRTDSVSGRKYRLMHPLSAEFGSLGAARKALSPSQFLARTEEPQVEVEITQAMKQSDMALIPHPFVADSGTIVLLDPVSPVVGKLFDLHENRIHIGDLLREGYVSIDNIALPRSGPPGVMVVGPKWKLTP